MNPEILQKIYKQLNTIEYSISKIRSNIDIASLYTKKREFNIGDTVRSKSGILGRYIGNHQCLILNIISKELSVDYIDVEGEHVNDSKLTLASDSDLIKYLK